MPKDKSSRLLTQKGRAHSLKPYSSNGKGQELSEEGTSEACEGRKDWEEATCPICMEFPHNAVLLLCSSHDRGCRPYVCNTSHRHSNCLDQYQKAHLTAQKGHQSRNSVSEQLLQETARSTVSADSDPQIGRNSMISATGEEVGVIGVDTARGSVNADECMEELVTADEQARGSTLLGKGNPNGMICPLCRGKVHRYKVIDAAREYLNLKSRSCAQESCVFTGTYEELRAHARDKHPLARPSYVDPARQREWARLEQQRDIGDVLSSFNSALSSSAVLGDYVFEDDAIEEVDIDFPGDEGHWWTVFLLFQVFGPVASLESRRVTRIRSRGRHSESARPVEENVVQIGNDEGGNTDVEEQLRSARRRFRHQRRS